MGRNKTTLPINADLLRDLIKSKETFSERAEQFGVSKQALNQWMVEGRMPPRALCELVMDLKLPKETVDDLLKPALTQLEAKKRWTLTVTLEES